MSRNHGNSPTPVNAYNPWVIAVDHGNGRYTGSRAKSSGTRSGTSIVVRILQRVRAVGRRGAA